MSYEKEELFDEQTTGSIADHVREILRLLGEDPEREGLLKTPTRVAKSLQFLTQGYAQSGTEQIQCAMFDEKYRQMVLVKDIELYSMCEHHLLPFHGEAHVGYLPGEGGHVTGLSKVARLVDGFARRPQVQERLTSEIADALVERLGAKGVIVIIEAEHLCMSMRGVRKPGSRTVTSAVRGHLRNPATRAEAMSLLLPGR